MSPQFEAWGVVFDIDRAAVEILTHRAVNDVRRAHDLDTLSYDRDLVAIARNHSDDMADREYVAHESPEGNGFADRYADAGYDCRVNTGGGHYLGGAENIALTHAGVPLGTGKRHESADDVAAGLVDGWMDSPSHRENILTDHWQCEGIGVTFVEDAPGITVYATQNFC
jgi:uncharacterized protein YkwD